MSKMAKIINAGGALSYLDVNLAMCSILNIMYKALKSSELYNEVKLIFVISD